MELPELQPPFHADYEKVFPRAFTEILPLVDKPEEPTLYPQDSISESLKLTINRGEGRTIRLHLTSTPQHVIAYLREQLGL